MPSSPQDRIVIVLVRARNPSNIGAVARAMHDLSYHHLRIVNEFHVPFQAAQAAERAAVDASSVLAGAREFETVADAVAGCTLVLGTTAVGDRGLEHPLHTLAESVPILHRHLAASPEARIALLFGSEKTGLSKDELSHCHALLTIPMNAPEGTRHLSMNLGQAVAICLYTLAQQQLPAAAQPPLQSPAESAALERLTSLLLTVLETSGYARRHPPANSREPVVRRLVRRMALGAIDAQVWTGMLRQLLHALKPPSTAPQEIAADDGGAIESKM